MSRMFRVISGPTESAARREVEAEQVPFIEVGGPGGTVSSFSPQVSATARPKPYVPPVAPPAARVQPTTPPTPAFKPSVAAAPAETPILSVTFHRFPKPGLRLMANGVAPDVVAYHFPDHAVSAEYRRLCDEIFQQFDVPGSRVGFFAASESNSGTTTVLVNFAVSLVAHHGLRVLVVDANFGRPGVARRLACAEAPGLADVLGQSIPLAWALQPTPLPNLHILSTGTVTDATEEALSADLPKLIAQLRQWFDWVIIDGGVWAELPGGDGAASAADGVYLVTRDALAEQDDFVALRSEISSAGGPVRGFVTTKL